MRKTCMAGLCVLAAAAAAWFGTSGRGGKVQEKHWEQVAPGIMRTVQQPYGYALLNGDRAVLIDAPQGAQGLDQFGVKKIEFALLTRHDRDVCTRVAELLGKKIPVRAPKTSAAWLAKENVRKYWQDSIPLRGSRTAYFVVAEGFDGIDFSLQDGQKIPWAGWQIEVIATPGHSEDHVAYAARNGVGGPLTIFCGDAMASAGKMWAPFTTDWDHWTDLGLAPAAKSLRTLAKRNPDLLLPAHGPAITKDCAAALEKAATAVAEVGFLKSFERFTKERLGNAPKYKFLVPGQAKSNGSLPWSQVSKHLFLTGNTYVLVSKDNGFLVIDPWAERAAKQVAKLKEDRKLGKLEVVMFSHAHYDHYDGVYHLPDRESFQVWMLDTAATPVAKPFLLQAPFLDPRPVKFDKLPRAGDTLTWREYKFLFHHLPGQSYFTSGIETAIDGKRCYLTADNFFHQDMYSGSGGWMGLNRSWPLPYAESAQKVLDAAPDWVLAEHGGPFEFNTEDFKRRVQWGKVAAKAIDVMCISGNHRHDWDPYQVHVEPLLQKAKPGDKIKVELIISNSQNQKKHYRLAIQGTALASAPAVDVDIGPNAEVRRLVQIQLKQDLASGRHILIVTGTDQADAFLALDVGK
jgi:glyoxylase-like metal-dependent hydrolase (beta-lactamase superfamily II)